MFKLFEPLLLLRVRKHPYLTLGSISLFVVIVLSLTLYHKSLPKTGWSSAEQVVGDKSLLEKVVKENTYNLDSSLAKENVLALKQGNLYIFDFNDPSLCGQAGCLYTVYTKSGKRMLSLLLNPHLPEEVELFTVTNTLRNKLPCLKINQSTTNNQIIHSLYCYESGDKFVQVNQSFFKGVGVGEGVGSRE